MPQSIDSQIKVGHRVRVTQQVQHREWTAVTEGIVEAHEQRKTGSWYAHAKDDKLWLDRLVLQKDDGEIVVCNLDAYSRVELLDDGGADGLVDAPSRGEGRAAAHEPALPDDQAPIEPTAKVDAVTGQDDAAEASSREQGRTEEELPR